MFARIMYSFSLPVSFANSGIRLEFGLANSACYGSISAWVVSAIEGKRGLVLTYLERLMQTLETYFQPANTTTSSENLHTFVSVLCSVFADRVYEER